MKFMSPSGGAMNLTSSLRGGMNVPISAASMPGTASKPSPGSAQFAGSPPDLGLPKPWGLSPPAGEPSHILTQSQQAARGGEGGGSTSPGVFHPPGLTSLTSTQSLSKVPNVTPPAVPGRGAAPKTASAARRPWGVSPSAGNVVNLTSASESRVRSSPSVQHRPAAAQLRPQRQQQLMQQLGDAATGQGLNSTVGEGNLAWSYPVAKTLGHSVKASSARRGAGGSPGGKTPL